MNAYKIIRYIILKGNYNKSYIMMKLDAYLAADRITVAQYQELVKLMEA